MENKTEILAERGGLKLVLKYPPKHLVSILYYIQLGGYIVAMGNLHDNGSKSVGFLPHHDIIKNKDEDMLKETATKMAIEWFNSLFENND